MEIILANTVLGVLLVLGLGADHRSRARDALSSAHLKQDSPPPRLRVNPADQANFREV